eukprot:6235777-Amphidinium_carterae.1
MGTCERRARPCRAPPVAASQEVLTEVQALQHPAVEESDSSAREGFLAAVCKRVSAALWRKWIVFVFTLHGSELERAPQEFKRDREIVLAAVCRDARAIQYVAEEFKKDREIVLAAVRWDA